MAKVSARIDGGGRADLLSLVWVGVASVALVYAMLLVEQQSVHHALHVTAPLEARPGTEIAVTGYVFDSLTESGDPELVRADVAVSIDEGPGTSLAMGSLDVASASIRVPDAAGDHVLRAVARVDGTIVATCQRTLHVAADAAGAPELSRTAPLLMFFSLGPIVTAAGAMPPPRFDVRVQAGVCIPEEPCTLVVDLGAVGYDVELVPGTLVERRGSTRTDGTLVAMAVAINGPEGDGELVVRQAGVEVARRTVRFPIALGTPWLDVDLAAAASGRLAVEVAPPPGRHGVVLDVLDRGQWIRSITLDGLSTDDLLGTPLPPGLYRIEARADRYPTDRVTSRVVRVGDGGADVPAALAADGLAFEMAAAEEEEVGLALPEATSGLETDVAALEAQKRTVRWLALLGMGVGIAMVIITVARRGAAASAQAGALMKLAGGEIDGLTQRRANLTMILAIAGLAMGLLGALALVMARSLVIGP